VYPFEGHGEVFNVRLRGWERWVGGGKETAE